MSGLKMELKRDQDKGLLTVSCQAQTVPGSDFRQECIKAARAIGLQQRSSGVVLLLENSFESLAMLESFVEAGVDFETATLNCGQVKNPIVKNWGSELKKLGISLHEVHFDYKNSDSLKQLEQLQKQFDVFEMRSLTNMWAACNFDQHVVFSGKFLLPKLGPDNSVTSIGLPIMENLAQYDFAQSLGAEPFFLSGTFGQIKTQAESDFVTAYVELQTKELLGFYQTYNLKRLLLKYHGFKLPWKVSPESEHLYKQGLRYEDRSANEAVNKILDLGKFIVTYPYTITEEVKVFPKYLSNDRSAVVLKELREFADDLTFEGGIAKVSETEEKDIEYACFPLLVTEHRYKKDISPIFKFVKKLPYYKNTGNYVSDLDLQFAPEMADLVRFFNEKIKMYFETAGRLVTDFEITQCWANKAGLNEIHHPHRHPNSMISGIFYFNDGGGGETSFFSESPENIIVLPTNERMTPFNTNVFQFRPEKGKLILVPSYLTHQVGPHLDKKQDRYTIAFNAFVRGNIGEFSIGSWLDLRRSESQNG